MTAPPPNTPVAPPPRTSWWVWLRRGLLLLLQVLIFVVLGAIALVGGWVQSDDFEARAIALVEGLVEQATGEVCEIDELTPRFWPPAVEVAGFHLNHHESGDIIVRADRARAPLVLRDGGLKLGRVTVDGPFIWLHLDEKGKPAEFQLVPPRDPDAPRRPLTRLPWSSLQITDGAFRLTFPRGQLDLTDLDVVPVQHALTDLSAELRVRVNDLDESGRLEIAGIELGPEVIEIPPFEFRSRPLILSGYGTVPLQGDLDLALQLRVPLEEINEALVEPRKAHGQVFADLALQGPPQDPTVTATVLAESLSLELPGVFTPVLGYDFGDVSAAVTATKGGADLHNLTVKLASGTLEAWGHVTPELRLERGHVVGDRVMLRELLMAFDAAPTPWIDMTTDLEVAWEGTLKPLRLEGHFDFLVADLRVGDRPIARPDVELMLDIPKAYARGTILLEKDHVYLSAPTVVGPKTRASFTVDIGFGPRGPLDLQADIHGADLAEFQPLKGVELGGRGRVTGRIWGPFNALQMAGTGDVHDFSVLEIPYADHLVANLVSPDMKSIQLRNARARRGETEYGGYFAFDFKPPMGMDVEVTFEPGGRVQDMVGAFIDLPGMKGDLTGTLSLHGPLFDLDGASHLQLANIDLWGEKFDAGEAHGFMDAGLFTLDDVRVWRHDRREGLVLRGSVERSWALNMELFGDGLALERMTRLSGRGLPLTGNVALHAHITNTLFDPSPDGRIAITDVRYNGYPVEDSHLVFQSNDGVADYGAVLFGGAAEADGTLGLWGEQPYAVTVSMRDLPVHLLYPIAWDGSPIRATATGDMTVGGHFGEVWSPVELRARLDEVTLRYRDHELRNRSTWHYAQDGNSWRIQDFGLIGGPTDFELSATGGEALDLSGRGRIDLGLLSAVVPGLEKARGIAAVELFATGAAPNVEAVVEVDVTADLLRHSSVPASFEDLTARLRITDDRISVERVSGSLGGGTITGSGTIEAEGWLPRRYDLTAKVKDAQIQWVDSLPPAIGNATLRFDGPYDAALLSGEVTVTDMPFSDRIDWEDWVVEYRDEMLVDPATVYEEEDASWFALNIAIAADRTIRLRNNVAEGIASAQLRVIGDTARPGLVGRVQVDEGLAFLQDREFVIDRGDMLFNDPWTWDPDLDFDLVTDLQNLDQRFRVNYLVFGPFSNWRTETRSDPPLPQADVNALLWFGATTEQLAESGEQFSAVAQGVADMVLTDFFLTNAGAGELGGAQDLLQVDRVDLATGVNARGEYSSEPRLAVEWGLEELGDLDLTWEMNLVRPDDNYVSVEKPFGGAWSLAGWYATQQRDRVLPIGGAYGVDVTWRGESD